MVDPDPASKRGWKPEALPAALCAVAGWLAFYVPFALARGAGETRATNPIDGMQAYSLLGIAFIGFVAGAALPRRWWLWGPCSMAAFPCIAVVEMFIDSTSHNLFPIEFFFYGLFTLPGIAGSILGAWIGRMIRGPEPTHPPATPG